jgi:hypothetical protein
MTKAISPAPAWIARQLGDLENMLESRAMPA